jgi:hypothetical protein
LANSNAIKRMIKARKLDANDRSRVAPLFSSLLSLATPETVIVTSDVVSAYKSLVMVGIDRVPSLLRCLT